jgi:putative cardiolipin synthase
VNFGDVDVLGIGPVVADTSAMFDEYWNHRISVPIHALVDAPKDPAAAVAALRHRTREILTDIESTPYGAALSGSALEYLENGVDDISFAPYQFVYDPPVKPTKKEDEEGAVSILTPLRGSINATEEELIVVSPYFVLPREAIERVAAFEARGVNVRVVTNSLASNNHAMVHSGYAPTRKPLLKEGVEIYEVRPDARVSGVDAGAGRKATLHTKAFIVDRRWAFLGSFNWDPRSAYINTESGIIIDDRGIAEDIAESIDLAIPTASYTVFLDEKDRVRWKTTNADGEEVVWTREPETGAWTRFKVGVMSMLPLEGQL